MAVAALTRSEVRRDGVQPFDPRRHMRQVTELVGSVFAAELDAGGRSALRDMRLASRFSPVLGGLLSVAFFQDFVSGYVWLDGGRVVGNVTFQRSDYSGARWRISNVAVAPEHRGRGIARALLLPTLREIAQRGGDWAILQVRTDNAAARQLYRSLGFTDVCQDGLWKLPLPPAEWPKTDSARPRQPPLPLRRLPALAWSARLELAYASRAQLAQWAEPVSPADYGIGVTQLLGETLGRLTGLYYVERWGVQGEDQLLGAVETVADAIGRSYRLRFAVRPDAYGQLEQALVSQGLRSLANAAGYGREPVHAAHSGDHAAGVAALEAAGFRLQRMLLTMRREITPADAGS